MAYTVAIGSLVEDLIRVTINTPSAGQIEEYKKFALREFSSSPSGRTDHFNVNARLEGLEEKARILNDDRLSDALQARLAELSSRSDEWTPEVLSLLLQLSDRPVQNTKVKDLILLGPDTPAAPLTWADIVVDDPLDDHDGIWENVDFSADVSDEDESIQPDMSDNPGQSPGSSVLNFESIETTLESLIVPGDANRVREIEDAQFWQQNGLVTHRERQPTLLLTELQVIREVIFIFLGLPASICTMDAEGSIHLYPGLVIRQVSQRALADLLQAFVDVATKLATIRRWTKRRTAVPLEQTFQAALASRLVEVDSTFHKIQGRILHFQTQFAPSLMQLYHEVNDNSRLILQSHEIINNLRLMPKPELPFGILERYFDVTCFNQSMGDADGYEYMARLFFDCFQTYLRPLQYWMERAQLSRHDQIMFVRKSEEDVPLGSLWQKQYYLLQNDSAQLHAPRFLHLAAKKIFNTGKSVEFLRQLGYELDRLGVLSHPRPELTFEKVCQPADLGMLSPFTELFDMAFDGWITSQYHSSSSVLRRQLETECGLQRSLDALEFIYFCRNGAISSNTTVKIFERIDHGNRRWNDSFVLTKLFQEAFSSLACVDVDSLEVRSSAKATYDNSQRTQRSMSVLEDLCVNYTLSWPVANIVRLESMEVYQRVSVFVTQIQRAKYLLQRQKLSGAASKSNKAPLSLIYRLHYQLLWLTNTILTYTMDVVLSATTTDMRASMRRAEDMDSMIKVHEEYISQLQDRCLLTKQHSPIRQAVISLLDLTVLFSDMQALYVKQPSKDAGQRKTSEPYTGRRKEKTPASDDEDDDSDDDTGNTNTKPMLGTEIPDIVRLQSLCDTFRKLHGFVTAAVQGISKANEAACWEILANSLAAGLGK